MTNVYFDVGANDGHSLLHLTSDPNNIVYGFEPTPRMLAIMQEKVQNIANYIIVPKAVSDYNGKSKFKISGQADWGCSSLCDFNDNLEDTWKGRTDFHVTDVVEVDVIRLDDFITENNITQIEHLHVDAQGMDLEVLFGLGEKICFVKSGVIEMPTRHETKLYKNQKYIVDDAVAFLEKNGFKIDQIQSNDPETNEVNVFFSRNTQNTF